MTPDRIVTITGILIAVCALAVGAFLAWAVYPWTALVP